ncbi:MAG: energy-coupled thiamine transporter ThiT [Clostridia bacterium]|nr:energy-coupled thiamine transporter ThiT [Clostridia bacterium]
MTKKITITGIMLSLATVLSLIRVFDAPYGGSVTAGSMVPILLLAFLYGTKWGIGSGILFGLISIFTNGLPAPPVTNFLSYAAVIVLDYVLAFGVLGLAGVLQDKVFCGKMWAPAAATVVVIFLRFVCHFLSGILIWGIYAWDGVSVPLYSFLYNGSYMLFELIISLFVIAVLSRMLHNKILKK